MHFSFRRFPEAKAPDLFIDNIVRIHTLQATVWTPVINYSLWNYEKPSEKKLILSDLLGHAIENDGIVKWGDDDISANV